MRDAPGRPAGSDPLDPSQIAGRPEPGCWRRCWKKILAKYETEAERAGRHEFRGSVGFAAGLKNATDFARAWAQQIADLAAMGRDSGTSNQRFADLMGVMVRRSKYQVDELAAIHLHRGAKLTVEEALEVKAELEAIDRLLEQIKEAAGAAAGDHRHGSLAGCRVGQIEELNELQKQVEVCPQGGRRQGWRRRFNTPRAMKRSSRGC
jgi:hypothetical protein